MKKKYVFPLCFWFLGLLLMSGQVSTTGPYQYDNKLLEEDRLAYQLSQRDSLERWEERIYVHTDREQFSPGEHIFFKAYVVNRRTQRRWSPNKVLKLELRDSDNKVVDKQYHPLNNGVSEGSLEISGKMQEGNYRLLAYTRWMQNYGEEVFFSKDIQIGSQKENVPVPDSSVLDYFDFYPEGGHLIGGIRNRMVIFGRSDTGSIVPFEADLVVTAGGNSFAVNTYEQGIGQITFTPSADHSYFLRSKDGRQFPLPAVKVSGYTLKINNLDAKEIFIQSERQGVTTAQNIFVQGWIDKKLCFENELSYDEEGVAKLEVSLSGLPTGMVYFRLADQNETILAERPVWITRSDQLDIQIEQLVPDNSKGYQNTFKISVRDTDGKPVQTDLSVSVRSNTSEQSTVVGGTANELSNGRKERFLKDLKVLGKSSLPKGEGRLPEEIIYPIQQGLEIVGYAYDLNNELLVNQDIQLLGVSDSLWIAREVKTDATGLLRIQDLDFEGDTQIVFRSKGEDTRERLVKLIPLTEATLNRKEKKVKKLKNIVLETTPWQTMDTTGLIELDPATVSASRNSKQTYSSQYGTMIRKQDVVVQDPARPRGLLELINEIPGIRVVGLGSERPQIQILRQGSGGSPLWVLDGVPLNPLNQVPAANMPTNIFVKTPIGLVPDVAIDRVEFLFGPAASIYGSRATSGVFLVYTRDGADSDFIKRKEGQLKFKGFTPRPDIGNVLKEQLKKSKRRANPTDTFFWNPSLRTDENGQVLIQFRSPADIERVQFHVESITPAGQRGSKKQLISLVE